MQFDLPRVFGRYTLLRSFGSGGMGGAYLAATGDAQAMRLCVVKVGLPDPTGELALEARLADEAKALLRLSCPNIVTVFDVGTAEGVRYVAMEYVEGRDLEELIAITRGQHAAFPGLVAAFIGREIARGLHYAHQLGVVHRDVSPPNVVLSFSGEVKVIDFGLAHSPTRADLTTPGLVLGHVGYLAPERLHGEVADQRSDVYSLGAILWELLTGETLFPARLLNGGDGPKTSSAVAPPSSRRSVDSDLDEIVLRALAPERGDRFADAEAMRAALATFIVTKAPSTDHATLSSYMKMLVGADVIEAQRKEGDRLLEGLIAVRRGVPSPIVIAAQPEMEGGRGSPIGTVLAGKYQIERLCGSGGMGDVYQARHVEIGRKVAVKLLKNEFRFANEVVERFAQEARLAAKADHENIVEMLDAGTTADGTRYLVMEYVEGETLQHVIERDECLPIRRALAIALAVVRAFERAHDAGVIHRDLKPGNVMVASSPDGTDAIKVLDFGVSKAIERGALAETDLTRAYAPVGSPHYMAPEQARGEGSDRRSDIYAVGELLYEMLTGWRAWDGADTFEIIRRKSSTDPRRPVELRPEVSETLDQVIMQALARDPDLRQQSMGELRQELEGCLRELDDVAVARGPRRPAMIIGAGIAIVAVLTGGALLAKRSRPRTVTTLEVPSTKAPPAVRPEMTAPAGTVPEPPPRSEPVPEVPSPDSARRGPRPGPDIKGSRAARSPAVTQPRSRVADTALPSAPPPPANASGEEPLSAARRLFAQRRYSEALIYAKQAVTLDGNVAASHIVLGDVLFMLTQYNASKAEYEAARRIDPNNQQASRRLVQIARTLDR